MPEENYDDSEEDEDYDPGACGDASEEGGSKSGKKRKRDVDIAGGEELVGSARGKALSSGGDPLKQLKADAKKAKINAIWESLKCGSKTSRPPSTNMGTSIGQPAKKMGPQKATNKALPSWMVSLGISMPTPSFAAANGSRSAASPTEVSGSPAVTKPEGVQSTETVSIASEPAAKVQYLPGQQKGADCVEGRIEKTERSGEIVGSIGDGGVGECKGEGSAGGNKVVGGGGGLGSAVVSENSRAMAAAAIAAAKAAAASMNMHAEGRLKVTEVRDFAGQAVEVTTLVDPNSKAAQAARKKMELQASSSRGLDAMLAQIEKKKKLNILDKSRKDWGEYKEDKGVVNELETFKKSGSTYTERVAFLNRAEVREYEKEREARLAAQSRRRTSGASMED